MQLTTTSNPWTLWSSTSSSKAGPASAARMAPGHPVKIGKRYYRITCNIREYIIILDKCMLRLTTLYAHEYTSREQMRGHMQFSQKRMYIRTAGTKSCNFKGSYHNSKRSSLSTFPSLPHAQCQALHGKTGASARWGYYRGLHSHAQVTLCPYERVCGTDT